MQRLNSFTEHMSSLDHSIAPLSIESCKNYLDLLDGLNGTHIIHLPNGAQRFLLDEKRATKVYKTWFVARVLSNISTSAPTFVHRFS